jgi:predicted DNA-binding ribbon-helix-helix protein
MTEMDMRTTLDLEEDILMAVREIARRRGVTMGKALSDLAVRR